ncbi:hypothetical protein [Nocardia sp. BMG51109]|uniref:hypothetical protein n=1 Tax=Nocardia sp. BMG51109 TaxID=1056816 RepID=UPI0012EB6321|nr:hypothetical protein [Nocardia sp. BMG51109]
MMRTPFRCAAASIAAAALVVTAAGATAEPIGSAPVTPVEGGTGSSTLDSGSAAAQTAVYFIQTGNVIGFLTLLVATPLQIMTGTVCEMATLSALPSPCPKPR